MIFLSLYLECNEMNRRVPLWFLVVIIAVVLPVAVFPKLLSMWPTSDGYEMKLLLWLYPGYVVASGFFAYLCWPSRRLESWILIVFMLLSHVTMWSLVII